MTFVIDRFWLGVIATLLIEVLWALIYYNRHKHDYDGMIKVDVNGKDLHSIISTLSEIERKQNGEDNNNQGEQ